MIESFKYEIKMFCNLLKKFKMRKMKIHPPSPTERDQVWTNGCLNLCSVPFISSVLFSLLPFTIQHLPSADSVLVYLESDKKSYKIRLKTYP